MTLEQRSDNFELPSLLNIGLSYDFIKVLPEDHRLSTAATFTSNSFKNDQYRLGLEYSFRELVTLRGGYNIESGGDEISTAISGPSAGFSVNLPLSKESDLGVDYSFRQSDSFGLLHSIGFRINL